MAAALVLSALSAPPAVRDLRSVEVVRLDCGSDLGRGDLTLFANGTLRRRSWDTDDVMDMHLAELPPDEVEPFLARVRTIDLSEVEADPSAIPGGWIETCDLRLELEEGETESFRFSRAGSLPLALSRLLGWVEELGLLAGPEVETRSLPSGYSPLVGDVLLRHDGLRYEVLGWTSDGRALELAGRDRPVTLYVLPEGIETEFVALVEEGQR